MVEHHAPLPFVDEAFASLAEFIGANPEQPPPEPFGWDVDHATQRALFQAAARLWRRAPWDYMTSYPPIQITLGAHGPEPKVLQLFASLMGGGDVAGGVVFTFSAEAMHRGLTEFNDLLDVDDREIEQMIGMLRQLGAPIDQVPPEELREAVSEIITGRDHGQELLRMFGDCLTVFYEPLKEIDPTYAEWIAARKLPYASRQGVPVCVRILVAEPPRNPTTRETRALALALEALSQFFSKYRPALASGWSNPEGFTFNAQVEQPRMEPATIEVRFPPPVSVWPDAYGTWQEALEEMYGDEDEDEEDAPMLDPTPEGPTTLYRFKVTLDTNHPFVPAARQGTPPWRRIELRGDQTLHDLHAGIQQAFGWDDDHLYAFFLSGKPWDEASEYDSPWSDEGRSAADYLLEHLPLVPRKKMLYIFDFGDDWRHAVTLEKVVRGGAEAAADYPRVTERAGANIEQYPSEEPFDEAADAADAADVDATGALDGAGDADATSADHARGHP